jgi:hypothetical protein
MGLRSLSGPQGGDDALGFLEARHLLVFARVPTVAALGAVAPLAPGAPLLRRRPRRHGRSRGRGRGRGRGCRGRQRAALHRGLVEAATSESSLTARRPRWPRLPRA